MPAQRPRASFEAIPPEFDVTAFVEETPGFQFVDRISCDMIDQQGMERFDKLVLLHVVVGGKPLIIDGYQSRLDPWTFSPKWLIDNHGDKVENARNLTSKENLPLTIGHYLKNMSLLTNQYFDKNRPENYRDKNRQRMYLKDIDCPPVWNDKLKEHLPPNLFYLNESVGEIGGPGAVDEPIPTGGKRKGKGIAPAGDLMSSLPPQMRAENMMCYIGHEGTYTPAHGEMCASLGHNIMVDCSDLIGEDGKEEHPGSSIWFMTETKDRHIVSEYWLSTLGHDIEVENHFAQLMAWKQAPFTKYVVEQKTGDFILIPPMAPHQVWNRGTRTMKAAWNRITVETLEEAIKEALPNARMVCRDEQYKIKAIIYYTLQKYSALLARARDQQQTASSPQEAEILRTSARIRQLQKDFKRLFILFKDVLLSEMFAPDTPQERNVSYLPYDSNVTCAYCRCNIFNRFLTCPTCDYALGTEEPEPYDVCMDCYAMGRSCGCISKLRWCEQFKWKELVQNYESWRRQFIEIKVGMQLDSPQSIGEERQRLGKKTLAQICQEQLKRRPWVDIQKSPEENEQSEEDEEIVINDDGTVKKAKTKKRRSEAWIKNHHSCHVCCHQHEKWKMAECECGRWYCYGSLFRGQDLMPQTVMENPKWKCSHCQGCCIAGGCRKDPRQKPYEPKGTLLGHDTKKVADARSVESLVDFGVSNLNWLRESALPPRDNSRLLKRQEEADRAKLDDPTLDEHYATDEGEDRVVAVSSPTNRIEYSPESTVIDPQLVDPLLVDEDMTSNDYAQKKGGKKRNSKATLVNGMGHVGNNAPEIIVQHPGYEPATQPEFVAPSVVMWQQSQDDNIADEDGAEVPFQDPSSSEKIGSSKKRKVVNGNLTDNIIRQPSKKARHADERVSTADGNQFSGATKQYHKEQERKALDEARKNGRFIQVYAKLKGRTKVIKLSIGNKQVLAQLQNGDATRLKTINVDAVDPNADAEPDEDTILVRSDIAPKPSVAPPRVPKAVAGKSAKSTKQVLVRSESDDEFRSRHRVRNIGGVTTTTVASSKKKERGHPRSDETGNASDTPGDNIDDSLTQTNGDGALITTNAGDKKRRMSSWQKQIHQDDEGLPDALPEDWKEGRAARKRNSRAHPSDVEATGKQNTAHSSLSRRTNKASGRADEIVGGSNTDMDEAQRSRQRATASAAAALLVEEENRQAKLEAAKLADSGNMPDEHSVSGGDVRNQAVNISSVVSNATVGFTTFSTPTTVVGQVPTSVSILLRQGPGRRKVKIVSGASRRRTTGGLQLEKNSTPDRVSVSIHSSPTLSGAAETSKK